MGSANSVLDVLVISICSNQHVATVAAHLQDMSEKVSITMKLIQIDPSIPCMHKPHPKTGVTITWYLVVHLAQHYGPRHRCTEYIEATPTFRTTTQITIVTARAGGTAW